MDHQVSVFIMDVSNSSVEDAGEELSEYLHYLEEKIASWTKGIVTTKVSHRFGDEVVVVASGFATAYTLAFYISRLWKFKDHKPYFGLSFGTIKQDISDINLETWIDPLMKHARNANDGLQQQGQNRAQFSFELNGLSKESVPGDYQLFSGQFEILINTILKLQHSQISEQTDIQSLVSSLVLILNQQNKVSNYIGRSPSTISSHMKIGKNDSIMDAFKEITAVLSSLEPIDQADSETNDKLQKNIKLVVANNLRNYFPANQ